MKDLYFMLAFMSMSLGVFTPWAISPYKTIDAIANLLLFIVSGIFFVLYEWRIYIEKK